MKYTLLILIAIIYACNPSNKKEAIEFKEFEFAILDNEPIFEDEYLFEKEKKKNQGNGYMYMIPNNDTNNIHY